MTIVSNDPALWSLINLFYVNSCFQVVPLCIVIYDCTLTFGQELDLIWSQQWSLMTVLYLIVRYIGIPFYIINLFQNLLAVPLTDAGCNAIYIATCWLSLVANTTLQVIMIARLYAMYCSSKKMLVFLVAIFLSFSITSIALAATESRLYASEEIILSGTYQCIQANAPTAHLLAYTWIVGISWEVIALSLAIWSAIKHFRERLGGWTMDDYFAVLIQTHVFYFISFLVVSSINLGMGFQSSTFLDSVNGLICMDIVGIMASLQMCVLGPRLILGVRGYRAKVMIAFDETTDGAASAFRRYSTETADNV